MRSLSVGISVLLCGSTIFAAQSMLSSPHMDAAKVCETGKQNVYGHPSNACWIAHEQALQQDDHARALAYMKLSCRKYLRSEHCLLASLVDRASRTGGPIRSAAADGGTRASVQRVSQSLFPADHEDGEAGVVFYELLRSHVLDPR
jgi:hypothetical protein